MILGQEGEKKLIDGREGHCSLCSIPLMATEMGRRTRAGSVLVIKRGGT